MKFHPWFLAALLLAPVLAQADGMTNAVIAPHARDLVVLQKDRLVPYPAEELCRARYIILLYSAGWCVDCRAFAPTLVKAYDTQRKGADRFEVLLVSQDKSATDMLDTMKSEKMRWPALAFAKVDGAEDFKKLYSGHGIPCLTVIDQAGKVVLQSKTDQDAKELLKTLQGMMGRRSGVSEN